MKSLTVPEFMDYLAALPAAAESVLPEAVESCESLVIENIVDNFARESTPEGEAWPQRKDPGDGHPLLVETNTEDSGSLFVAATGQGAGSVRRMEDTTLVVGVDKSIKKGGIPGAAVHQFGYPERNIPQRRFLGIGERTKKECGERIGARVLREMV